MKIKIIKFHLKIKKNEIIINENYNYKDKNNEII